jgi:hypothetical protein
VQELFQARQKQLGLVPASRENGEAKLLRPALVHAMAMEARDAGLRRELDRLGRAQLGLAEDKRAPRLPSELVELALSVAVQEGGMPVIDRAVQALGNTNDGIARGRLLAALGNNQNPTAAERVMGLSLEEGLRTNERLVTVLAQFRHAETREAAYAWLTQHYDALVSRLGRDLGAQLTFVAGAFCSEAGAERARKFFEPHVEKLAGGPRLLRLNLESSELCAAFVEAHRTGASQYFAAAGGS